MNLKRSNRKTSRLASPCNSGFTAIDPFLLERDGASTSGNHTVTAVPVPVKHDSQNDR